MSGCPRNCAEATVKDIGVVAVEGGWQIRMGGAAGATVREADLLRYRGRPSGSPRPLPSCSTTASTASRSASATSAPGSALTGSGSGARRAVGRRPARALPHQQGGGYRPMARARRSPPRAPVQRPRPAGRPRTAAGRTRRATSGGRAMNPAAVPAVGAPTSSPMWACTIERRAARRGPSPSGIAGSRSSARRPGSRARTTPGRTKAARLQTASSPIAALRARSTNAASTSRAAPRSVWRRSRREPPCARAGRRDPRSARAGHLWSDPATVSRA